MSADGRAGRGPTRRVRHGQPARRRTSTTRCTTGSAVAATSPVPLPVPPTQLPRRHTRPRIATRHRRRHEVDGLHIWSTSRSASRNQNGEETMPGTAQVVLFGDGDARDAGRTGTPVAIPTANPASTSTRRPSSMAGRAARTAAARCRSTPTTSAAGRRPCTTRARAPRELFDRRRRANRPVGRAGRATRLQPVRVEPRLPPRGLSVDARHGHRAGLPRAQRRPEQLVLRADARRRRRHRRRDARRRVREGRHGGHDDVPRRREPAGPTSAASWSASAQRTSIYY